MDMNAALGETRMQGFQGAGTVHISQWVPVPILHTHSPQSKDIGTT